MHDFVDGITMLLNVTSFVMGVATTLVVVFIIKKVRAKKSGGV